ncbi:MAG TPA: PAS domain S-box protein [Chthoniobacterales bacterium]|nr:PAS domain S-box protein [Chthoniobacterales bacterium]
MRTNALVNQSSAERADELFQQHRHEIFRNTDRLFAKLMLFQWIAAIATALLVSPTTWSGQSSQIHIHVWAALVVGGAVSAFPIWMTRLFPGAAVTRHTIAVAQMLMSTLLIALTGGRIETHFHIFGSLVVLSFYRDWRVLVSATAVVAVDHLVRGIYWPYSTYGVLTASPWRFVEHAGWVVFEDIFLLISCRRSIVEMRAIANRTAALEPGERNFRQTFDEAPMGMAVITLDERIFAANARLCDMLGYSEEELTRLTTEDITFPEDIEEGRHLAAALLDGTAPHTTSEKRYVRKNKTLIWIRRTASLIRDEHGTPQHFLIMIEDISERREQEAELQESKRHLEAALRANHLIMDNSQDVICTIDKAGRFVTVNAASDSLWGYPPSELVGRAYMDLVHPDDRKNTNAVAAELFANRKVTDFVNRCLRKDGSVVDVLWAVSWSEMESTMFCVAHDVTERARIEKALREAKEEADRANTAKSEFLSRMSHELRTPLNAILGFGQLIERQSATDAQRSRVGYILSAGRHLLNLINEVLDISRIEAGNLQMSVEPVRLADAVAESIDLVRPLAAEQDIDLSTSPELDEAYFVRADRQRLKQVLLNLLSNAVKYTPKGGRVMVSHRVSPEGVVRLNVRDTGRGIAADKLSRLFTPFERLGAEESNVEGTGLGLALCQRLMHAMHGSVGVSSTVGNGSTFWIELAAAEAPLASVSPHGRATRTHAADPLRDKRKILYIEDNLSNLTLIEQILADQPEIELITAMQGRLGFELALKHDPDLILLDLHLPDLPGWKVLEQLKRNPATCHTPVVVISADATKRQIDRLLAVGARAYLTKPIDIGEFFKAIDETKSHPVAECVAA